MTIRYRTVESPIGPLTLVADDDTLVALSIHDQPPAVGDAVRDTGIVPGAVDQLEAYFDGELTSFDVRLRLDGTGFQRQVWNALREIPYGETRSYADIARRVGRPSAFRAVGLANGRNPIAIIVPCHRVIGANGALVGYGGGLDRKQWLLALEAKRSFDQPQAGRRDRLVGMSE